MKKVLFTLALAAVPAMAFAGGTTLTWNDCVGGPTAASNKNFVCTGTANQNYDLIFQFKSPSALPNFVGLACFADYQNQSGTPLSPFWHYEVGGCNNTGSVKGILISDVQPPSAPSCHNSTNVTSPYDFHDPWNDAADGSGGSENFSAYGVDFHRPGNGYFVLADAYTAATSEPIDAEVNYYAMHLRFNNRNKVACPGCSDLGYIVLERVRLESNDQAPVDIDNPDLTKPTPLVGGGNETLGSPNASCVSINGGTGCLAPVPVKNTSWGQIKSLYK